MDCMLYARGLDRGMSAEGRLLKFRVIKLLIGRYTSLFIPTTSTKETLGNWSCVLYYVNEALIRRLIQPSKVHVKHTIVDTPQERSQGKS